MQTQCRQYDTPESGRCEATYYRYVTTSTHVKDSPIRLYSSAYRERIKQQCSIAMRRAWIYKPLAAVNRCKAGLYTFQRLSDILTTLSALSASVILAETTES